uniref:Protein kinase domain-containing protein n=1 Tax=Sexangularia sp. CB-2014 TaxID=1486929 RepID=A0A7S1Y7K1_9EUKA|mmetsp:Transcript_1084/g.3311  ORF Transcript_1084/g.3311 Transcript_1084/m.3311 type:complete len:356 (+) Transcript_1084:2-1069(+)
MAGTYTAPPRSSGSASTTLTPPESYEAPPTRGTKSTGSVTSDDPYSAPPSSNSAGGGPVEDAGTYDAPPVKLAANDTLRRRAKDEVPKKFVIAPTDLDKGKLIGQGGYGYVYRGVWREVAVAIKEIREVPDPKVSREAVKQMVEEAIMMCDLRPHTNLIQFFGICLDPISIVLEFAAKGALEDALYGRKKEARIDFTAEQRLAICLGAGRGVHHLHQEGVVHRDLAARNVLLTASLEPKLTDFGMAREGAEDEATTTATKVGPIRWMAPEQLSDQVVSTASDVWAFGALMYEVYACEQPFGKKKNMVVAKQVMDGGHCDIPASAPESVQQAMNACFEHDHEKRVKMKSILTMLEE